MSSPLPLFMRHQPTTGYLPGEIDAGRIQSISRDWPGIAVKQHFTTGMRTLGDVWASVKWEESDVVIEDAEGKKTFEMKGCMFPDFYSDRARKIIASKYFMNDTIEGKPSMAALITRVVLRIVDWGKEYGYYADDTSWHYHMLELAYMLLHQKFAFNSPVWFNFGIPGVAQQGSACFIVPVGDSLDEIDEWCRVETRIFKRGSGSGADISGLRSSYEKLSVGGYSSGPLPFMKVADVKGGAIKSAGTTRRAAKMVTMYVGHPDILECRDGSPGFIRCKVEEEKRAQILIDNGVSGEFNVPHNAYENAHYQNANHSVRACDAFMEKAVGNDPSLWCCMPVNRSEGDDSIHAYDAQALLKEIGEAAWFCGDPGMQFSDTINQWNTCPNSGTIKASNPCSEYLWFDDTACNLASLKLTAFVNSDGDFEWLDYEVAVDHIVLAMEMIVAGSEYPTDNIARETRRYRNLGLGHADLGALLMRWAIPYDSREGRSKAAMLSSAMTAMAYKASGMIAKMCGGPFIEYKRNFAAMNAVLEQHQIAATQIDDLHQAESERLNRLWTEARMFGDKYLGNEKAPCGYRNANATVHAPTGTIAFLMDCETTGIEPSVGLVVFKKLVGGGTLILGSEAFKAGLAKLDFDAASIERIEKAVRAGDDINTLLVPEAARVFETAFGDNCVSPVGHLDMVAALQPHISMGISKTINLPNKATVRDIVNLYKRAWRKNVKCISVYRDGCKRSQPLTVKKSEPVAPVMGHESSVLIGEEPVSVEKAFLGFPIMEVKNWPDMRRKLPTDRDGKIHKFQIGDQKGYLVVGLFEDGTPGEIFISMSKEGSTIAGLLDAFATAISFGLQYGVPLEKFCQKFAHMRFEPNGWTPNADIPMAKSIIDYIFRWLELAFVSKAEEPVTGVMSFEAVLTDKGQPFQARHFHADRNTKGWAGQQTGPECRKCQALTIPAGKCHVCPNCGDTDGCS